MVKGVDGRDKRGHDKGGALRFAASRLMASRGKSDETSMPPSKAAGMRPFLTALTGRACPPIARPK